MNTAISAPPGPNSDPEVRVFRPVLHDGSLGELVRAIIILSTVTTLYLHKRFHCTSLFISRRYGWGRRGKMEVPGRGAALSQSGVTKWVGAGGVVQGWVVGGCIEMRYRHDDHFGRLRNE